MVFNDTFNNISVISWWSVLLVEYQEKTTVTDKFYHIMCIEFTSPERDSKSQRHWRQALIAQVVINPTTIRSRPPRPLLYKCIMINIIPVVVITLFVQLQAMISIFFICEKHLQDRIISGDVRSKTSLTPPLFN